MIFSEMKCYELWFNLHTFVRSLVSTACCRCFLLNKSKQINLNYSWAELCSIRLSLMGDARPNKPISYTQIVKCKNENFLFPCDYRQICSTTFACCANNRRNQNICTQGRNEVRWLPRQETSLGYLKLRSFGSKCTVLKKVAYLWHCWDFLAPSTAIRCPNSDPAPGEMRPTFPPRYAPACTID